MAGEAEALRIVETALAVEDPSSRAAFVVAQCAGDAELLARVRALLARDDTDFRLTPTDTFSRPLSVVDAIPDRLGPYRVTGEIARGGMGAVVKGERDDGVFQQTVAIKLIRGDLASDRAKARFAEERRILARLRHAGIVRIIDGGDAESRPWLAMDYVDGAPIDQSLSAQNASLAARLDAFEAVCEAVAYAHRHLVVHADIKPSNVLRDGDGAVHLLDFGIARLMAAIDTEEVGDPYPLTKGFAAPERGVGTVPTIASDVFSMGVLLLAMLGKQIPGADAEFLPGTRLPKGALQGDLAAIAAKALAELPDDRYADVPELLEDIRRHRGWLPVAANGQPGWRYRVERFLFRNRRLVALGSAIALILLATSVVTTVQYWRAERARAEAEARFAEVRSLSRFLLFDVYDRLADAPGTVAVRARLAETARTYLDRLNSVPNAPADLQLDLARSYRRLATIQGLSGTSNLGQPELAQVSLRRAETLLAPLAQDDPGNANILTERGWIGLANWTLASDTKGESPNGAAMRDFAAALRLHPNNGEARLGLLISRSNQAFDLEKADRHAEAIAEAAEALSAVRAAPWPADLRTEARMLEMRLINRMGDAHYYSGDLNAALAAYREGADLARDELAKGPSLRWEDRLAEADFNVGSTLADLARGRPRALAITSAAIERLRGVLSTGQDAALELRLIILLGEKSLILDGLGHSAEAAEISGQQIAMRESRLAAQPGDVTRKRDLVVALAAHAELLAKVGERNRACGAIQRGLGLMDALAQGTDLAARDRRTEYAKFKTARERYCR